MIMRLLSTRTALLFYLFWKSFCRAGNTGGAGRAMVSPLFCVAKRKNGNKGKSRKDFKVKTIKMLSSRLKFYCFSHSRGLRFQKFFLLANHDGGRQYFPVFFGPSTFKSISPACFVISLFCF